MESDEVNRVCAAWWQEEYEATREEVLAEDPVARECTYVTFVSRSNGRGRSRRRPRSVELIGYGGRHYSIRKDGPHSPLDVIADEVLGESVPSNERYDKFLQRVRKVPRRRR